MLNPYIAMIEGDLSRADVVGLITLCRGKDVVEFGLGGSTILLSKVAKSLITYETKPDWVERFRERFNSIEDKTCTPEIRVIPETRDGSSVVGLGEPCDVLFDDGWALMRFPFIKEFWPHIRECVILHDTRATYAGNNLKQVFDAYQLGADKVKYPWGYNPITASLKTIEWNYLESNLCVMFKRNCELTWEDWKQTEKSDANRSGYGKG